MQQKWSRMIATLDRPDLDGLDQVDVAWDPAAVDWRVMNDEADAVTDARTQFEVDRKSTRLNSSH